MGLGDEVDLHTVHFHGQTILYRHERQHVADVYELGPGMHAIHGYNVRCLYIRIFPVTQLACLYIIFSI